MAPETVTPRVITTRTMIETVAERWKAQYCREYANGAGWTDTTLGSSEAIYNRLVALPVNVATPYDVARAISVEAATDWCAIRCDLCKRGTQKAVQFPGREYATDVCAECIRAAYKALHPREDV